MKKINSLVCLSVAAVMLASCGSNAGYKKTKSGLLYKVITSGKDTKVKEGDWIKFNIEFRRERGDSVLNSSYGKIPGYAKISPLQGEPPYNIVEVFPMLHANDSAVAVMFMDSVINKSPMQQLPPFLRKNDKVLALMKVVKVFTSDSAYSADREVEMTKERSRQEQEQAKAMEKMKRDAEEDLKTQVPQMEKWLADKKINAVKTGTGTFVVVKEPGTGMVADSGKFASVRYTGKTLDDKVFQSNMDGSAPPFTFEVGVGGAIRGWDEGLKLFRKGGKGTLYIPGALAYGRTPREGSPFKPNEALIFDIEVVDVSATPPPQPGQMQAQPADTSATKKKK